jgi:hypothetical protein
MDIKETLKNKYVLIGIAAVVIVVAYLYLM